MNIQIDSTPLLSEIFKTQAYIKTFASVILSEEQKDEFNKNYTENLKKVIAEFIETFPNGIENLEELKETLSKKF